MTYRPRLQHLLVHPRTPPVTANAKDEEWDDRVGMSGPINGLDPSWTIISSGSETRSYAGKCLILTGTGGVTPKLVGMVKAQPSTPYTVTCRVAHSRHPEFNHLSLGFYDGTKFWVAQFYQDLVTDVDEYRRTGFTTWRYGNSTTRTSSGAGYIVGMRQVWLQVTNDGANVSWAWSPTGVAGTFETVTTESYATALLTPTHFFIGVDSLSVNESVGEFGPVRVT